MAVFFALYSAGTFAAPGETDAGQIINQIEKNTPSLEDQVVPELKQPPEKTVSDPNALRVAIKAIQFSGNKSVATEKINEFLTQFVNQSLTLDEIKAIANNLSLFYRNQGFIAEVVLPDQDITNGNLQIQIIEATLGEVLIEQDTNSRLKDSALKAYFSFADSKELNLKKISDRILIVNELPGIKAEAALRAGQKEGSTDVIIQAKSQKNVVTSLSYDNYGSRSTGFQRAIASLVLNNPIGFGDQVSATALKSEGVDYIRLNYEFPIAHDGLKAHVNSTYLEYDVILREFDTTKPYGYSNSFGGGLNYPLSLDAGNKWVVGADYQKRSFLNKTLSGTSSDYETRVLTLKGDGRIVDNLFYNAYNQIELDYDRGEVDLGGSPNKSSDADGANTQGSFNKFTLNASRSEFLNADWILFGKLQYQWADANLDSSEKLYLGGPNGVRAYPLNEGSGSKGFLANLEVKRTLPWNLTATAFYDLGHVQQYIDNHDATGAVIGNPNRITLKGYGLGLNWKGPYSSDFDVIWSKRIGNNPNPATTGGDQDGSNKDNFVWLRAGVTF